MMIHRREFCGGLTGMALLAGCGACQDAPSTAPGAIPDGGAPDALTYTEHGSGLSRVVQVRWAAAVDPAGRVDPVRVQTMLHGAVARLTGGSNPWATWAGAGRIGIKVNSIDAQAFTHPELADAAARALCAAGVDPAHVAVWDRDTDSLRRRGYPIDRTGARLGYRCLGSDAATDEPKPSAKVVAGGARVHLSPLLTSCDVLINVAALKDHSMAGVTLSLKNNLGMIYGAELLHGDFRQGSGCEPGISDLAALPEIRGRLQLVVLDALVGICDGGPGPADPARAFRHAGLLVGRDPVALDRLGLSIIEARRATLGLEPLAARRTPNPSPAIHIDNAAGKLS